MNILYIAYSCDPYEGSEDQIGWRVPVESAKTNRVCVITKEEHRESVKRYLREHPLENIRFYFVDIPGVYKKIFKGFAYSGRLTIWHRRALPVARRICAEQEITLIHQITPVEFRAVGDYQKIPNIRFVCGPLGGAETIPRGLQAYAGRHGLIEIVRAVTNCWNRFLLRKTGKLEHCDYVMFANRENRDYLLKAGRKTGSDTVVTEIAIDMPEKDRPAVEIRPGKVCTFLVAGRMIYRKGYGFLLDALAGIPEELPYVCRIVGGGPELKKLQRRCVQNGKLSKHVVFPGTVPFREMESEYRNADVLIMPSIRETTGSVLLEAMSRGIPVITVNQFGAAAVLDRESGWLYDGTDRISYIEGLTNAIEECIYRPEEVSRRGRNARKKAEQYTWEKKNRHYQTIYRQLLET